MDEYIKREEALNALLNEMVGTGYQSRAMDAIKFIPTADVVPRADLDLIKSTVTHKEEEAYNKGYKDGKADMQSKVSILTVQNMALENTKSELQHELNKYKGVENILKDNMGELIMAAIVQAKQELASEIFAEVNMQIFPYSTDICIKGEELIIIPKSDYNAILTELKKKYTEGEDKPASEEKYFSPEDVRKMTNQEVREKYTAIRESMKRW